MHPTYHPSWEPVLAPVLEQQWPRISQALDNQDYLPPAEDVCRALQMPLDDVRVLIVGPVSYTHLTLPTIYSV